MMRVTSALRVSATLFGVASLLLAAATGRADPSTHDLDGVVAAVNGRVSTTSKTRKAIASAKAAFAKTSLGVADDLRVAGAVAATLDRAFKGDAQFGAALDAGFTLSDDRVRAERGVLAAGIPGLTVAADVKLAQASLAAGDAVLSGVAAKKTRAAKFAALRKAVLKLDAGVATLPIVEFYRAKLDGVPFDTSGQIQAFTHAASKSFTITAATATTGVPPTFHRIGVFATNPKKPGVYPQAGYPSYSDCDGATFQCGGRLGASGALTITRLDFKRHIIGGTFQMTATFINQPQTVVTITEGAFLLHWDVL